MFTMVGFSESQDSAALVNVADQVANMPTDTVAQRIAKSTAYQQKRYDASRGGASGRGMR